MKFKNYIKDNIFSILFQINVFGMIAVLAYLLGNPAELIIRNSMGRTVFNIFWNPVLH